MLSFLLGVMEFVRRARRATEGVDKLWITIQLAWS